MRIVDLKSGTRDGWATASATVLWERRKRDRQVIEFATDEAHAEYLWACPEAFLIPASIAASFHFEPRVSIEAQVCPTVIEGLERARQVRYRWFKDSQRIPIECETLSAPRQPAPGAKNAMALSGGIDSVALLHQNRTQSSEDDAAWFDLGVVISKGFDPFEFGPGDPYWGQLENLARDTDLELVPIATNVRELEPANHFFGHELYGALIASTGHALGKGVKTLSIASGVESNPETVHEGSHPFLDPNYSSGAVEVKHQMDGVSRYEKTSRLADWEPAHERIKICFVANRLAEGEFNCGECEKCIRTKLTLRALDRLEAMPIFVNPSLDPSLVRNSLARSPSIPSVYPQIHEGLQQVGEDELAGIVFDEVLSDEARTLSVGDRLAALDRRILNGGLRRLKRRLSNR